MMDKPKILVVDDDPQIIRVLRQILTAQGYAVRTADDGAVALDEFSPFAPDLVLTDLQMPNVDGLELCRRLRAVSEVPIVVLSVRNSEQHIVDALDAGADDYITKPFGTAELLARIRSALRRTPKRTADVIESGDFKIDLAGHEAWFGERPLRLTPKEFELLACFLSNPNRILTHAFILREVWGMYYAEQSDALRVLIGSLRKKIEPEPANPKYLVTEPWIGYRLLTSGSL